MVLKYFGDDEAYKVAMNLEKEGMDFYSYMAENARSPQAKKVFSLLLEDEKRHFAAFRKLDESAEAGYLTRPAEIDEEINAYIKSLVSPGIFKKLPCGCALAKMTDVEALNTGIQAEKDSILFYTHAREICQSPSGKKAFFEIGNEEKRHLVTLTNRLHDIDKGR